MTKMIALRAHRYAGRALSKDEEYDVAIDRHVRGLVKTGRARLVAGMLQVTSDTMLKPAEIATTESGEEYLTRNIAVAPSRKRTNGSKKKEPKA